MEHTQKNEQSKHYFSLHMQIKYNIQMYIMTYVGNNQLPPCLTRCIPVGL